MKLLEITRNARNILKQFDQLWTSFAVTNGRKVYDELMEMIEKHINSLDNDISKNAKIYHQRLKDSFIDTLRKE